MENVEILGYSLKGFKEFKYGHGDSRTFSASLCYKGQKIAEVSNDGCGGCDEYHFENLAVEQEFSKAGKAYGEEKHGFDDEDMLIEDLIVQLEEAKLKARNAKKGRPYTYKCRSGKTTETLGKDKKPFTYWLKEWYVSVVSPEDFSEEYRKKEKIEEYIQI